MAYGMVSIYGMSKKVGQVSFHGMGDGQFQKPYSETTANLIDEEVRLMVETQYQRAKDLLTEKREALEILAKKLLEKEVLVKSDVERLIGERPYPEPEKAEEKPIQTLATADDDTEENDNEPSEDHQPNASSESEENVKDSAEESA
jgi:cell division protease FtsH